MMSWWRSNWMAQLGHMCTQTSTPLLGQAAQLLRASPPTEMDGFTKRWRKPAPQWVVFSL